MQSTAYNLNLQSKINNFFHFIISVLQDKDNLNKGNLKHTKYTCT